jgi:hypothetical protein
MSPSKSSPARACFFRFFATGDSPDFVGETQLSIILPSLAFQSNPLSETPFCLWMPKIA